MRFLGFILIIFNLQLIANSLVEIVLPNDQWKLIGVSGAFMEGSGTGEISTGDDWYFATESDSNGFINNEATTVGLSDDSGTSDAYDSSTDLVRFNAVNSNYQSVTVSFDISDFEIDDYMPIRKMYVDSDSDGTADVNISYQSDLEGEIFHIKTITDTNEESSYYGYFNSSYGETNPFVPTLLTGTSSTYSFEIRDIVDMNLTNNPGKDGQDGDLVDYKQASYQDDFDVNDYIKIFRLDSVNNRWESFNSKISDSANDFTTLNGGSAYWVWLHDESEDTEKHGFILGDGNISVDTFSSSNSPLSSTLGTSKDSAHTMLDSGWNMLSFPDGNIRYSATGLVMEINDTTQDGNSFKISDEVGKESFDAYIYDIDGDGTVDINEIVRSINNGIAGAIEDGNLSKNFNIRAFAVGDGNVILISDKRFRVYDINSSSEHAGIIKGVKTIGGQNPYILSSNNYGSVTNLSSTGVASKYGEYSLIFTVPNDGAGNTAGSLNSANQGLGSIQINDNNGIDISGNNLSQVKSKLVTAGLSNFHYTILDLDGNDENDSILIVNTSSPFYIRDHTFTKVYRLDDNHPLQSGDPDIYFDKSGDDDFTTITLDHGSSTVAIVTDLNDTLNTDFDANVSNSSDANYTYITTVNSDYRDFDLKEFGTDDIFTRVTSNNPLALGAITKLYSLSDLAKADVNKSIYSVEIDSTANPLNNDGDINISIDNIIGGYDVVPGDEAGKICYGLKVVLNSLNANIYAECNTSDSLTDTNDTSLLTVTGYFSKAGIINNNTQVDLGGNNNNSYDYLEDWDSASIGGVALNSADSLIDDLTYTPFYSPDFPTSESILPYIRENDYTVNSILTAVDNGSGSVSWKYLDLTTDADDWFSSLYDYDLFSIEKERGYFLNLESSTSASLSLTSTLNLNFYQHYNNDNNVTGLTTAGNVDNFFDGTLTVKLSGDEGDNSQVVATIQNRDYTMFKNGSTYSLELTRTNFPYIAMSDSNITITAYDETGNIETDEVEFNLSSPATPVFKFFNGKIAFIGSTSSDLSAFNIYSGRIDDLYSTSESYGNFASNLTPDNDYKDSTDITYYSDDTDELRDSIELDGVEYQYGSTNLTIDSYDADSIGVVSKTNYPTYYFMTYNICADAPDFDTYNEDWRVVAVDGDGDAENSRVSNITFLDDWYSIYKNASILKVGNGVRDTDNKPALYDSDCLFESNRTIDNGVILDFNSTKDLNITIAYDTISTSSVTSGIPTYITFCYDDDNDNNGNDNNLSKIQFSTNKYVYSINTALGNEKILLIDINNTMLFKTTFDALYDFDQAGNTNCFDLNKTDVDDNVTRLNISNGQRIEKIAY
jgi:hypothetical protein